MFCSIGGISYLFFYSIDQWKITEKAQKKRSGEALFLYKNDNLLFHEFHSAQAAGFIFAYRNIIYPGLQISCIYSEISAAGCF